ncbi:hypothetical protein PAXINDRAFT_16574 [Paxillus involutus ATCC 200175]|uniref:Uncharacterized protein n=1 Tax=Paxillus involutus ATCC 200175 TaxID=664439 RepID=A0A0C9SRF5_PAXIN|nr:hypothetical protein PAXINDRAFT_16574 [Paxillus involutus ATCC 200175]
MSTKWTRSQSRAPSQGAPPKLVSQQPPALKKARSTKIAQDVLEPSASEIEASRLLPSITVSHSLPPPPQCPHKEVFDRIVLPLPSRSFGRRSLPVMLDSPQPEAGPAGQQLSEHDEIGDLRTELTQVQQQVLTLCKVVEALQRKANPSPFPLPQMPAGDLALPLLNQFPASIAFSSPSLIVCPAPPATLPVSCSRPSPCRGVEVPQVYQLPASIVVPVVDLVSPSTNADISPVNPFGPQPDGKHDLDIPIISIEINAPTHQAISINTGPSPPPLPSPNHCSWRSH